MRPKIPDPLAQRIQQVYESAGYATESEFVRDAIRRRLEAVEESQNVAKTSDESEDRIHDFEYTSLKSTSQQMENDEFPPIHIRPEDARIADRANQGRQLVLSINGRNIKSEDITTQVEQLDIVANCSLTRKDPWDRKTETDGWIQIRLAPDRIAGAELDSMVDLILNTIDEAVVSAETWENSHQELENALRRQTDT